jgi:Zn-dependent protease with chaperone function
MRRKRATPPRPDLVSDVYLALGNSRGRKVFDEVLTAESLRPRVTRAKMLAGALAGCVHAVTVALAVGGVALIVLVHEAWSIVVGIILLLVAWSVRPRAAVVPDRIEARRAVPAIYDLVDRIAHSIGTRRIHGVAFAPTFNASIVTAGWWRRRTYVTIGLPLFDILAPQERVAVLAHELGHEVNGDPRKARFVGSALRTLSGWNALMTRTGPSRRGALGVGGFVELAETVTEYLLVPLRALIRLIAKALLRLIWHESQRAEYLADDIARCAAGTDAAVQALEKIALAPVFRQAVQTAVASGRSTSASLFDNFRSAAVRWQEANGSRLQPSSDIRLDATHPPTALRIEFTLARKSAPMITLTPDDSNGIDRELGPIEVRMEREIADEYRASLYRGGRRR